MVPGTGCGLCGHFNFYIYLLFFFLIHYPFQHLQRLLIPLCPHRGTGQQELRISLLKMMLLFFQKTPDRLHRRTATPACAARPAISADVSGLSSSMRTRKPASPRCVRAFSPKMRRTASHKHFAFAAYNFLDFRIWLSRCPSRINWPEGNLLCLGRRLVIKTPPILIPFQQIRRRTM